MFIIFCLHDSPIECPGAKPLDLYSFTVSV